MPISNEMNQNLGDETLEPMNQNSLEETKKQIKDKIKKLKNEKKQHEKDNNAYGIKEEEHDSRALNINNLTKEINFNEKQLKDIKKMIKQCENSTNQSRLEPFCEVLRNMGTVAWDYCGLSLTCCEVSLRCFEGLS